jgi:hypothetical protein
MQKYDPIGLGRLLRWGKTHELNYLTLQYETFSTHWFGYFLVWMNNLSQSCYNVYVNKVNREKRVTAFGKILYAIKPYRDKLLLRYLWPPYHVAYYDLDRRDLASLRLDFNKLFYLSTFVGSDGNSDHLLSPHALHDMFPCSI